MLSQPCFLWNTFCIFDNNNFVTNIKVFHSFCSQLFTSYHFTYIYPQYANIILLV